MPQKFKNCSWFSHSGRIFTLDFYGRRTLLHPASWDLLLPTQIEMTKNWEIYMRNLTLKNPGKIATRSEQEMFIGKGVPNGKTTNVEKGCSPNTVRSLGQGDGSMYGHVGGGSYTPSGQGGHPPSCTVVGVTNPALCMAPCQRQKDFCPQMTKMRIWALLV